MSNDDIRDHEVYNTKTGARGYVVAIDPLTITINIGGINKSYTHSTFNKWWIVVPTDKEEEEEEEDYVNEQPTYTDDWGLPAGKMGVGLFLRDKFISLINDLDIDEVLVFHNPKRKSDVIKYNDYNVFECRYTKRRFIVYAHPKSLTPMNRKQVYDTAPKSWKWSLDSRFIFTKYNQWPLMKSIINDGLFYRSDQYIDY